MKETLASIQTKISEVTSLKYIDEDWGQLDDYSPNMPVQWPCCLIDFSQIVFQNIGKDRTAIPQQRQIAEGTITITIANQKLTNTSFAAPQMQKQNAWSIYDIIEDVHKKIHGWRPVNISGALIRTQFIRRKRDDGVQEYNITYTIGLNNV